MPDPTPELWTIDQAADHIGATTTASARRTLSRWGIIATTYRPHPVSRRAQALYDAEQIRAAKAARPRPRRPHRLHTT